MSIYIDNQSVINVYKKYIYIARRPVSPLTPIGTKMGISYSIQNGLPSLYIQNPTLMVPPDLPQVLCQLEVPHQLGALQVQGITNQSSLPPLLLFDISGSATMSKHPHTTPGPSHPGCGPTCPPVHLIEPS
jgi:hypothetical protein